MWSSMCWAAVMPLRSPTARLSFFLHYAFIPLLLLSGCSVVLRSPSRRSDANRPLRRMWQWGPSMPLTPGQARPGPPGAEATRSLPVPASMASAVRIRMGAPRLERRARVGRVSRRMCIRARNVRRCCSECRCDSGALRCVHGALHLCLPSSIWGSILISGSVSFGELQ